MQVSEATHRETTPTPGHSGSIKLNFLGQYAKEGQQVELGLQEVELGLQEVSPHLSLDTWMKKRLPAHAYPGTGLSCTVERERLSWARLIDETKDKYREKLHQNSGHRC